MKASCEEMMKKAKEFPSISFFFRIFTYSKSVRSKVK